MDDITPELDPEKEDTQTTDTDDDSNITDERPVWEKLGYVDEDALTKSFKEKEQTITRLGQENASHRSSATPDDTESSTPDFWDDPDKAMDARFDRMEQRMESRRQTESALRNFSETSGISNSELNALDREVQMAAKDPEQYLQLLGRLHGGQNTEAAVQAARAASARNTKNNARATTASADGAASEPLPKNFDDMSVDEQEKYLIKKHGKADYGY